MAERKFIHVKSTGAVVGFNAHLLERSDVEIVDESRAQSLQRKEQTNRRKERDKREQQAMDEAIKRANETSGLRVRRGDDGDDEDEDDLNRQQLEDEREEDKVTVRRRERKSSINAAGKEGRESSHQNLNNDPNAALGGLEKQDEVIEDQHVSQKDRDAVGDSRVGQSEKTTTDTVAPLSLADQIAGVTGGDIGRPTRADKAGRGK